MNESKGSLNTDNDFFDRADVIKWMLRIFYSVCIVLVAIDLVIHRHVYTEIEKIPAFYVIYAFLACLLFTLIAKQFRQLILRDEDFYKSSEDDNKKDNI